MTIEFSKYEGAGNDFVIIDNRDGSFRADRKTIAKLCHRRFGIGADGLMLLEDDRFTQFRMRYFNADGGESTMCGNGGRCMALYADHLGIGSHAKRFSAPDGIHTVRILSRSDDAAVVALGMSDIKGAETILDGYFVDSGSPHYVLFVDDVDSVDVIKQGYELRHDIVFEGCGGVNVNFVSILPDGSLKVRTYERGVEDETLACGTGVTASAVAAFAMSGLGKQREYAVSTRGGELKVSFDYGTEKGFTNIVLTGDARRIFTGVFSSENFM